MWRECSVTCSAFWRHVGGSLDLVVESRQITSPYPLVCITGGKCDGWVDRPFFFFSRVYRVLVYRFHYMELIPPHGRDDERCICQLEVIQTIERSLWLNVSCQPQWRKGPLAYSCVVCLLRVLQGGALLSLVDRTRDHSVIRTSGPFRQLF